MCLLIIARHNQALLFVTINKIFFYIIAIIINSYYRILYVDNFTRLEITLGYPELFNYTISIYLIYNNISNSQE